MGCLRQPYLFAKDEMNNIVENGYNKIAKRFDSFRKQFDTRDELLQFASALPVGANVLDAGCGTGIPSAKYLATRGFNITCIDSSSKMLELARQNVPTANFSLMDLTSISFRPRAFDGIIALYSVIHVARENHSIVFKSFHSVLKPHGLILLTAGSSSWEGTDKFLGADMYWSHYGPRKTKSLLTEAGFKILFGKNVSSRGERHHWILAEKS